MDKYSAVLSSTSWQLLTTKEQQYLTSLSETLPLSQQDFRQLAEISRDLQMWQEPPLYQRQLTFDEKRTPKQQKQQFIGQVKQLWDALRTQPTRYDSFTAASDFSTPDFKDTTDPDRTILGTCPVASPKTRCCNLQTLDAVINCGFDCSYCSIQSFYNDGQVLFESNLKEKLDALQLDRNRTHHIGTGQSSDSLLFGNHGDTLTHLLDFAQKNPHVALELKTKSDNIRYLKSVDVPANVICTWSLNPQIIIDNEEHRTASLERRIQAAREMADKGVLVGFHLHPMVYFEGWEEAYGALFTQLTTLFSPKEVCLLSLGTLTFIKPVLKKLRARDYNTKILQIPMEDAAGKFSYPYAIKKDLFSFAYKALSQWHDDVFFYMCMEDVRLWQDAFGYEYPDNDALEAAMLQHYFNKIEQKKG